MVIECQMVFNYYSTILTVVFLSIHGNWSIMAPNFFSEIKIHLLWKLIRWYMHIVALICFYRYIYWCVCVVLYLFFIVGSLYYSGACFSSHLYPFMWVVILRFAFKTLLRWWWEDYEKLISSISYNWQPFSFFGMINNHLEGFFTEDVLGVNVHNIILYSFASSSFISEISSSSV